MKTKNKKDVVPAISDSFARAIQVAVATEERRRMSERIKAGIRAKRERESNTK